MSPEEIQQASRQLQLTPRDFVQTYASHTLGPSSSHALDDESSTWIRLRDQGGSCVFLGDDGKLCGIYEARPVQCRTYPFWPNILQSMESWNEECRRRDDDHTNPLPMWTPTEGGCEGMKTLSGENVKQINDNNDETVPIREAYRQLYEYVVSDKRFPKGTERPLVKDEGSE